MLTHTVRIMETGAALYIGPGQPVEATLRALDGALSARDVAIQAHSRRVSTYALTLGRLMGLSHDELLTLERGVFLHDVGKLYVPDGILRKPAPLTEREWVVMRRHPAVGYNLIRGAMPELQDAATIVLAHHEWYDGTGYPQGLSGERIPLGARICSVVDTLDAITSSRPYRRPVTFEVACAYIRTQSGSHFDPLVVDAFLAIPSAAWRQLKVFASRSGDLLH